MRNTMTWTLAVGMTLAAAGTASAQGQAGFGMYRTGGIGLLTIASIQEELKITDEQKGKLQGVARQLPARAREQMLSRGAGTDREAWVKASVELAKEVAPILNPEQWKRFKEIDLQISGFVAFTTNDDIQKALQITDEQKAKYKKLATEWEKDRVELIQGSSGSNVDQQFADMSKRYTDKANEFLNADQRKIYQEMLGKPFVLGAGQRGA